MSADALQRLARLAAVLRERRLGDLREATRRCNETRALIAGLDAAPADDLPLVVAAQANMAHGIWAARRRAQLQQVLAGQERARADCRAAAAVAFGKAQVVEALVDAQRK